MKPHIPLGAVKLGRLATRGVIKLSVKSYGAAPAVTWEVLAVYNGQTYGARGQGLKYMMAFAYSKLPREVRKHARLVGVGLGDLF